MVLHEARNKERRVTEKIMFSFFTSKIIIVHENMVTKLTRFV